MLSMGVGSCNQIENKHIWMNVDAKIEIDGIKIWNILRTRE